MSVFMFSFDCCTSPLFSFTHFSNLDPQNKPKPEGKETTEVSFYIKVNSFEYTLKETDVLTHVSDCRFGKDLRRMAIILFAVYS